MFVLYFETTKMLIFGVCFILYFLNLSGKNGFWSNLRNNDPNVNRAAKLYQKCLQKYMKARHDVNFLQNCKTNNVFPKFVKWKNITYKALREHNKYYARNLNDALDKRRKELKHLETERDKLKVNLVNSTTWMKSQLLLFSIKRLQSNRSKRTLARHEKKLELLL